MKKHLQTAVICMIACIQSMDVHTALYQITNPQHIIINDNAVATPYPSPITITTANPDERITHVSLTINGITHEFPGDIAIALESPSALTVLIMAQAGNGIPVSNINLTFADSAESFLSTPLSSGTFKPTSFISFPNPSTPGNIYFGLQQTVLTNYIGQDPNGVWNLLVQDTALGGDGVINNGWTLTIETAINPSNISLAIKSKYCY